MQCLESKVTIAIPTFNRKEYLGLAIECCLRQTYGNVEILIVDNCSTDRTGELVKSIHDNRIVYFRQETPVPPLDNWNKCIELAKGDYFTLLPDDDLIAANYVESLLRAITEHESVSMVRCGVKFVDSEGVVGGGKLDLPEIATIEDYILADVHGRLFQSLSGAMCPTELVKALGGFEKVGLPKELYSDHLFWLKVAANGSKVITVQECLYFYRIHCGHMGIGINLRDFADGTKLYVAKYKRVVRERGIDSNISHYLDNEFATSIMKTRLAVTMSRMLRGTVAYSRTTLLRDLKLYLRPKLFDIRLFLFAMVLLINRNLANAMLKIFHFLRERLLARRGRHG